MASEAMKKLQDSIDLQNRDDNTIGKVNRPESPAVSTPTPTSTFQSTGGGSVIDQEAETTTETPEIEINQTTKEEELDNLEQTKELELMKNLGYTVDKEPQMPQMSEDAIAVYKAIGDLNYALQGIDAKVSSTFTGEVPEYIATAYVNNQKAYLLRQMDRYKYMAEAYKQEHSQKMDIYDREYQAWRDNESLKQKYYSDQLAYLKSAGAGSSGLTDRTYPAGSTMDEIKQLDPRRGELLENFFGSIEGKSLEDALKGTGKERAELYAELGVGGKAELIKLRTEYSKAQLEVPNKDVLNSLKILNRFLNVEGKGLEYLSKYATGWNSEFAKRAMIRAIDEGGSFQEHFADIMRKELGWGKWGPAITMNFNSAELAEISEFVGALQTLKSNNFLAIIHNDDLSLARVTDKEGAIISESISENNAHFYERGSIDPKTKLPYPGENTFSQASKIIGKLYEKHIGVEDEISVVP